MERAPGVSIFADVRDHFLLIRQRGGAADWLVKTRGRTRVIGALRERDPDYLSVSSARAKAADVYNEIRKGPSIEKETAPAVEPEPGWTWADLSREYQSTLTEHRKIGKRVKPPSKGTMDDVRLAFAKAPISALGPRPLADLTFRQVARAVKEVHNAHGHRAACKTVAYIKAALTWALSEEGERSGLDDKMPWWVALRPPRATGSEIVAMQAREQALIAAKVEFTVDDLGKLLVEHERFCAGRRANEKIGPGVRWGLWWVAFTGNRRFSTVALERDRLFQTDEFGREGWGRATWPAEMMKGKSDFWLPLPPAVLSIANGAVADWSTLVRNQHGTGKTSRWVFASTRRIGRIEDNEDVATYPSSLNAHLRALRGDKKGFNEGTNSLGDLPWFTLHLVRSVAGNFLDGAPGVPKAGISAMLAHADGETDDKLAPTTQKFYVNNQRMPEKAAAMEAWSEALCRAVEKAGGKLPAPRETWRPSKVKQPAA